jgi:hypothetical protein
MSYNGSGTFNINTAGQPVVTGTVISSTAFNALTADLATGLSTAITKDGQTAATARIPFAQGISSTLVTDSTNTTTGSIITAGGAGIAKALFVGTTANVAGAVTLQSTLAVGGVATYSAQPIFSSLTASSAVATDASKGLVSVTNTGTGNNVLATSPTLVTPILGTPSSGTLTNCTGLPNAGLVNSSVTVGSTAIALGATAATIAGLTLTTPIASTTIGVGGATASASGAGITFPATQSASSDANTLDDYEEGTWTPSQGAGLTVVGAFSSTGTYTKVGRLVTLRGSVSGATTVALATNDTPICGSIPFTPIGTTSDRTVGGMVNGTQTNFGATSSVGSFTTIYNTGTLAATTTIHFSVFYFV